MGQKWNRELIIRHILRCVAEGLPLTVGEPGISNATLPSGLAILRLLEECDPSCRPPAGTGQLCREVAASENSYTYTQSREAPSPSGCETA